jgi:negative regulator of sigma E activity
MTTPTPDDARVDELASALLDGALPGEEAAAANRDPAVVARAAELSAVRDRLRDVPPPAPAAREAAIAAALAAFEGEPARPARLADHRARRGRSFPAWLGAAATVAVVAGVVGALALAGGLGRGSNESGDTSTAAVAPEASTEAQSNESSAAGGAGAPVVVDLGDLGDFATADALAARVSGTDVLASAPQRATDESGGFAADAAPTTTAPATGAAPAPPAAVELPGGEATCRGTDLPEPPAGGQSGILAHAAARLAGTHVDVWLVQTATGTHMVALDTTCHVVADLPAD